MHGRDADVFFLLLVFFLTLFYILILIYMGNGTTLITIPDLTARYEARLGRPCDKTESEVRKATRQKREWFRPRPKSGAESARDAAKNGALADWILDPTGLCTIHHHQG